MINPLLKINEEKFQKFPQNENVTNQSKFQSTIVSQTNLHKPSKLELDYHNNSNYISNLQPNVPHSHITLAYNHSITTSNKQAPSSTNNNNLSNAQYSGNVSSQINAPPSNLPHNSNAYSHTLSMGNINNSKHYGSTNLANNSNNNMNINSNNNTIGSNSHLSSMNNNNNNSNNNNTIHFNTSEDHISTGSSNSNFYYEKVKAPNYSHLLLIPPVNDAIKAPLTVGHTPTTNFQNSNLSTSTAAQIPNAPQETKFIKNENGLNSKFSKEKENAIRAPTEDVVPKATIKLQQNGKQSQNSLNGINPCNPLSSNQNILNCARNSSENQVKLNLTTNNQFSHHFDAFDKTTPLSTTNNNNSNLINGNSQQNFDIQNLDTDLSQYSNNSQGPFRDSKDQNIRESQKDIKSGLDLIENSIYKAGIAQSIQYEPHLLQKEEKNFENKKENQTTIHEKVNFGDQSIDQIQAIAEQRRNKHSRIQSEYGNLQRNSDQFSLLQDQGPIQPSYGRMKHYDSKDKFLSVNNSNYNSTNNNNTLTTHHHRESSYTSHNLIGGKMNDPNIVPQNEIDQYFPLTSKTGDFKPDTQFQNYQQAAPPQFQKTFSDLFTQTDFYRPSENSSLMDNLQNTQHTHFMGINNSSTNNNNMNTTLNHNSSNNNNNNYSNMNLGVSLINQNINNGGYLNQLQLNRDNKTAPNLFENSSIVSSKLTDLEQGHQPSTYEESQKEFFIMQNYLSTNKSNLVLEKIPEFPKTTKNQFNSTSSTSFLPPYEQFTSNKPTHERNQSKNYSEYQASNTQQEFKDFGYPNFQKKANLESQDSFKYEFKRGESSFETTNSNNLAKTKDHLHYRHHSLISLPQSSLHVNPKPIENENRKKASCEFHELDKDKKRNAVKQSFKPIFETYIEETCQEKPIHHHKRMSLLQNTQSGYSNSNMNNNSLFGQLKLEKIDSQDKKKAQVVPTLSYNHNEVQILQRQSPIFNLEDTAVPFNSTMPNFYKPNNGNVGQVQKQTQETSFPAWGSRPISLTHDDYSDIRFFDRYQRDRDHSTEMGNLPAQIQLNKTINCPLTHRQFENKKEIYAEQQIQYVYSKQDDLRQETDSALLVVDADQKIENSKILIQNEAESILKKRLSRITLDDLIFNHNAPNYSLDNLSSRSGTFAHPGKKLQDLVPPPLFENLDSVTDKKHTNQDFNNTHQGLVNNQSQDINKYSLDPKDIENHHKAVQLLSGSGTGRESSMRLYDDKLKMLDFANNKSLMTNKDVSYSSNRNRIQSYDSANLYQSNLPISLNPLTEIGNLPRCNTKRDTFQTSRMNSDHSNSSSNSFKNKLQMDFQPSTIEQLKTCGDNFSHENDFQNRNEDQTEEPNNSGKPQYYTLETVMLYQDTDNSYPKSQNSQQNKNAENKVSPNLNFNNINNENNINQNNTSQNSVSHSSGNSTSNLHNNHNNINQGNSNSYNTNVNSIYNEIKKNLAPNQPQEIPNKLEDLLNNIEFERQIFSGVNLDNIGKPSITEEYRPLESQNEEFNDDFFKCDEQTEVQFNLETCDEKQLSTKENQASAEQLAQTPPQKTHQRNQSGNLLPIKNRDLLHQLKQFEQQIRESGDTVVNVESLNFLISREAVYAPDSNFLEQRQQNITPMMRSILFDWIMQVSMEFTLQRETFHITLNIVDRYLSVAQCIQKNQLQLIGVAAMYIASKMEEIYPPQLADFVLSADNGYSIEEIQSKEIDMMKSLQWLLNPPTLNMWVNWYMSQWDIYVEKSPYSIDHCIFENSQTPRIQFQEPNEQSYSYYREVMQIVDVAMLEFNILKYKPRMIVASVLYLVIGKNMNAFSNDQIVNQFPNSSMFIINSESKFNDLYADFLEYSFGFMLIDLFPTIQFLSNFFILPINLDLPTAAKIDRENVLQEFLAYQTHHPNNIDCIQSISEQIQSI